MTTRDPNNPADFSPVGVDEMAKGYKDRIAAAKSSSTPVGAAPMPEMPRLDQAPQKAPPPGSIPPHMTPEEYQAALAQGRAVGGVGAAYPFNQPTRQVGADGQPVNPPRPEGGLRKETIEQLEAVSKENQQEELDDDEDFFERLGDVTQDILSNTKRRKAIEEKITDELSFDDLITQQEIRQEVPILKTFKPVFREPSAAEDLFTKRMISPEKGSPRYVHDKLAIMNLACGLHSINGKPLPAHIVADEPDEEAFEKRFKTLLRYPLVIVADLSANFIWFRERVQNLLSIDKVKNF